MTSPELPPVVRGKNGTRRFLAPRYRYRLAASLILLVVSTVFLGVGWLADAHSVRTIEGSGPQAIALPAHSYEVYTDPGGMAGVPASKFDVTGPAGPVVLQAQNYEVSPYDVADLFLGTGLYSPTAKFHIRRAGQYTVIVHGSSEKVFVADTQRAALDRVIFWVAGDIAAIVALIVGAIGPRRNRSTLRQARRREPLPLVALP